MSDRPKPCPTCGHDPFLFEQAQKAALNTIRRDNERLRDRAIKAENESVLLDVALEMMKEDADRIREIIADGGTTADILAFLNTTIKP